MLKGIIVEYTQSIKCSCCGEVASTTTYKRKLLKSRQVFIRDLQKSGWCAVPGADGEARCPDCVNSKDGIVVVMDGQLYHVTNNDGRITNRYESD